MTTRDDLGSKYLRLSRRGPVAWLYIDRPEKRNAMTKTMYLGTRRAVHLVHDDPDLRALIITGTGDVFAPGGDLAGADDEPLPEAAAEEFLPFATLRSTPIPVVAAVNGICQAGGVVLASLCDIAIASDRATFRTPDVIRGFPETWLATLLAANIGAMRARDLVLTGRKIDAVEALAMGLVSRIVPHESLEAEAERAVYDMLQAPPLARAAAKRAINDHYGVIDEMTFRTGDRSAEAQEGFAAFVEKRPPAWAVTRPEYLRGRSAADHGS
jgi:enoyl-CoA hydratase/carnithine racemase